MIVISKYKFFIISSWLSATFIACGDDGESVGTAPGGGETATMDGGTDTPDPIDGGTRPPMSADAGGADAGEADAAAPTAPRDCSKADTFCAEAHGTYQGEAFACDVDVPDRVLVARSFDDARVMVRLWGCDALPTVLIPIERTGPFDYRFASGRVSEARVEIWHFNEAGGSDILNDLVDNFTGARVVGTITPERTVRATVTAGWGKPSAGCTANTADTSCHEASFTMTFNLPIP